MRERDQPVGLPTPVGRVEPKDRGRLATRATQTATDVREQVTESLGGVGVCEEPGGVGVLRARVAPYHACQISREVGLHGAGTHVGPGNTGIKDCSDHADLASKLSRNHNHRSRFARLA